MSLNKPAIKNRFGRIGLYFILSFIGITVSGIVSVLFGHFVMGIDFTEMQLLMMSPKAPVFGSFTTVLTFSVIFLITVIFRKFIDYKTINSLGFSFDKKLKDLFYGFLMGTGLILLGFSILKIFGFIEILQVKFSFFEFMFYLIVIPLAAMEEEILVRGYILNNLMERGNKYVSLLISSFIFAIMHIGNPNITILSFINLILAGVLLGIYYIHKKNLWFPFAMHLGWNLFQGPVLGFQVSGIETESIILTEVTGPEMITGGKFGFEGSILLTILMCFAIFAIDFMYKSKSENSVEQIIENELGEVE